MEVISIRTPSLGDATYIAIHGGNAVIIDPQRDIGRFTAVLDDRGLTLTHVLETHMHNDYISGGRDLARYRDADLVMPAASGAGFAFVPAFHNEDMDASDGLVIRPMHTPGHTNDSVTYVIGDTAFIGDTLFTPEYVDAKTLGEELDKLDKSKHYYLYCRSGNRSGQACALMNARGFSAAYNLMGGMIEWEGEVTYE